MKSSPILLVSLLAALACNPTVGATGGPGPQPAPDITGRTPAPDVARQATEDDREAASTMTIWLTNFRDEQTRWRKGTGRYADDVTFGGRVEPLPSSSYTTRYQVHQGGRRYWIQVNHLRTRNLCSLADGPDTPDQGKIVCDRV